VLNAARSRFGLPPLSNAFAQVEAADRVLLATSQAFDFATAQLPPQVRYVGPLLDQPAWTGDWTSPWAPGDARPLVLVAMSSTFQNQAPSIQSVLDAAATLPVRVLVTRGPGLAGTPFRTPGNAVVVDAAPHDQVMQQARVVVTHCGHGTIMRALANGCALLCMPMGRDQNDNAARVASRGVGLRLQRDAAAAEIRQALSSLLSDPSFVARSRALGQAIAHAEPATALEDELETLAGCTRRNAA
jgi:MGT family glycosyltransferase